ncbi:MAG: glycosyltransferase [Bacteroidales bacterium]|jgi:dolichol-phosphate mannosyltransferase|nr:glycosyltransferase [Bacteroidales bacterium]
MSEYRMTIIVPVFNELDNLDRIKDTFLEYLSKSKNKSQVLFIDDGSTDGSFNKILEICNTKPNFKYIKFQKNCGLSNAIKAGIDSCTTELIGYIDADLQTSPFDFDNLLQDIDCYKAVIGYRAKRKDSLSKKIQSLIANSIRRALINDGIIDTGCPLKVIKTETAKKIPFFDGMHRFLPALIQLQGGSVKQVQVRHFERIAGKSKFNLLNRSIKPLQDAFAYRWMQSRYINYTIDKSNLNV